MIIRRRMVYMGVAALASCLFASESSAAVGSPLCQQINSGKFNGVTAPGKDLSFQGDLRSGEAVSWLYDGDKTARAIIWARTPGNQLLASGKSDGSVTYKVVAPAGQTAGHLFQMGSNPGTVKFTVTCAGVDVPQPAPAPKTNLPSSPTQAGASAGSPLCSAINNGAYNRTISNREYYMITGLLNGGEVITWKYDVSNGANAIVIARTPGNKVVGTGRQDGVMSYKVDAASNQQINHDIQVGTDGD